MLIASITFRKLSDPYFSNDHSTDCTSHRFVAHDNVIQQVICCHSSAIVSQTVDFTQLKPIDDTMVAVYAFSFQYS